MVIVSLPKFHPMQIQELTAYLETLAPLSLQESYDNSGLIIGHSSTEITKALICLDVTEEVMKEAIQQGCNLIIAHHPLIFSGIKKINGKNYTERLIILAIQHQIAIYAIHTNLDNVMRGVNFKIGEVLGLQDLKILEPKIGILKQLITYVPDNLTDSGENAVLKVRNALWEAGAGKIGNYSSCSFNVEGSGTFKPLEGATPFIGEINSLHEQKEIKMSVIFPENIENQVIKALKSAHPYEEAAYEVIALSNPHPEIGAGMIGTFPEPITELEFLKLLKTAFRCNIVRHTALINKKIKKLAFCGGAGSFLLKTAMAQGADAFVSGDFKYHQFFDADGKILIADIGHFESEQYTIDLLYDAIHEKFRNFALLKTQINTNPVNYF